jgi:putative ABC transport system permease protein
MDTIVQDLRYGMRQLLKNPGFTTIAVMTLALGIGINATMFSMVSAILLRRPPGRDPDRVAVVTAINPAAGFQADNSTLSVPNYLAWKEGNHVFSEMAAADEFRSASLTAQHESEVVPSAAVSANYFNVMGVDAQQGRTFRAGEDQSGQDHVVILSHQLWERHFGSDQTVVGRTIRLNRENYTVIGIMPASFRLLGFLTDLWTPLVFTPAEHAAAARKDRSLYLFARMKPEATLEQAGAEFATLAHRAEQDFPDSEKGWGAKVRTLQDFLVYGFGIRGGLAVIMTTVGFVLMIACANVSGLLLARAAARRKELAIRLSMGAARLRIVRQLLTEGMLIALAGGALGLVMARWGIAFVRANMSFNDAVNSLDLGLDSNVVVFSTAISVACALLCALAPALKASRTDVATNLKDESRTSSAGSSRSRLRKVMVTGEIALALFLLVGTGLLFVAMFRIEHQTLGFQPDHLLTAGITLDDARYKDASHREGFARDLLARLQQIPSVESVAVTSDLPASGQSAVNVRIQGQSDLPTSQALTAFDTVVTPDYFRTAGMSLLKGRQFSDQDNESAPRVVVVNQKFVDRYLHGEDAIGKQIQAEVSGAPSGWSQIIGVVNNVKTYSEATAEDPGIFEPFKQRPVAFFNVMVRSTIDPDSLIPEVRDTVAQVDAELPLARLMSMPAVIDRQKGGNQFFTRALAGFAFLALLLAAIGIYGLIAYSVGQRTYEIGIRMAMGAKSQDVLRMIFREGLIMTAIGGAIGFAISLPLPKVFGAMFFDLHVNEPRLYFVVPIIVLIVACLASYIPARRAARVDPIHALRQD